MTTDANGMCPDFSSHWENAFDRLFPSGRPQEMDTDELRTLVDVEAEDEYRNCEGH